MYRVNYLRLIAEKLILKLLIRSKKYFRKKLNYFHLKKK